MLWEQFCKHKHGHYFCFKFACEQSIRISYKSDVESRKQREAAARAMDNEGSPGSDITAVLLLLLLFSFCA